MGGGGYWGMPTGIFLKNTLYNAFWRNIYTELRNQVVEFKFTVSKNIS